MHRARQQNSRQPFKIKWKGTVYLKGKKLNYEKLLCFPQMCGYLMKSFLCKKNFFLIFFFVLLRGFIAENFLWSITKKKYLFWFAKRLLISLWNIVAHCHFSNFYGQYAELLLRDSTDFRMIFESKFVKQKWYYWTPG